MMNRKALVAIFIVAIATINFAQPMKPNLNGTWERVLVGGYGNPGTETMLFVHNEPYLYLLYRIKDGAGERTLDLKGMTDGKPHTQEIEGQPATLIAQWEGQNFILDIKRERTTGFVHNRRKMTFSSDGKVISVERTQYAKDGELKGTGTEKWVRK